MGDRSVCEIDGCTELVHDPQDGGPPFNRCYGHLNRAMRRGRTGTRLDNLGGYARNATGGR